MNNGRFEFDSGSFSFRTHRLRIGIYLRNALIYILVPLAATVVIFIVFSLIYSTPQERRLKRENRLYERIIPDMKDRQEVLQDAITGLQYRDADIYWKVFNSGAPAADPMGSLDFPNSSQTLAEEKLEKYARDKSDELLSRCSVVDSLFDRVNSKLSEKDFVTPPMSLPVKGILYSQVGAGTGRKFNPFYKIESLHTGLDLMVPRGTPVYAPASGIVEEKRVDRTMGKTLKIRHSGGYFTVYSGLDEILVERGQSVSRGRKIAVTGMSGHSFAPHLHYEVYRDSLMLEPVNHFFASVGSDDYANMLYMSANTKQSMD